MLLEPQLAAGRKRLRSDSLLRFEVQKTERECAEPRAVELTSPAAVSDTATCHADFGNSATVQRGRVENFAPH